MRSETARSTRRMAAASFADAVDLLDRAVETLREVDLVALVFDASPEMLAVARAKLPASVGLKEGRAEQLPFRDAPKR